MNLARIGRDETLLEFLRREGPLQTQAVSNRFGWNPKVALQQLDALEAQGLVAKRIDRTSSYGRSGPGGRRRYVWAAVDPQAPKEDA